MGNWSKARSKQAGRKETAAREAPPHPTIKCVDRNGVSKEAAGPEEFCAQKMVKKACSQRRSHKHAKIVTYDRKSCRCKWSKHKKYYRKRAGAGDMAKVEPQTREEENDKR